MKTCHATDNVTARAEWATQAQKALPNTTNTPAMA
jgi:hypothetical protein